MIYLLVTQKSDILERNFVMWHWKGSCEFECEEESQTSCDEFGEKHHSKNNTWAILSMPHKVLIP